MKDFFSKNKLNIVFILVGALGGFLYWKFIGCNSGTCAIKSVWYWSTLWGAVMGYLVGDIIAGFIKKRKKKSMNKGRFQNIINSEKPVLVDFYADWCEPCKQMPPILKELKDDFKDALKIIKVDVDKNPYIATQYNIRSIPTIMIFKNAAQIWTGQGVKSKIELAQVLNSYM